MAEGDETTSFAKGARERFHQREAGNSKQVIA
jgi:hypothetical protein